MNLEDVWTHHTRPKTSDEVKAIVLRMLEDFEFDVAGDEPVVSVHHSTSGPVLIELRGRVPS